MKNKVKAFSSTAFDLLEKNISNWLNDNIINVVAMSHSAFVQDNSMTRLYTCIIIYKTA